MEEPKSQFAKDLARYQASKRGEVELTDEEREALGTLNELATSNEPEEEIGTDATS